MIPAWRDFNLIRQEYNNWVAKQKQRDDGLFDDEPMKVPPVVMAIPMDDAESHTTPTEEW